MPNHILSPTNPGIPRRRIFLLALSIIAFGFYLCSISDSRPEFGVYDRLRFGRHIDFEQMPVAKSQALPIGSNASVAMAEFPPPPPAVEFPSPLNGAPTIAFRDNLQPDVNYITAWPGASFTNDLMLYGAKEMAPVITATWWHSLQTRSVLAALRSHT
ncbi:hypothetical protein B0H10DRAFT_1949815 [Mycena sp. CBHHK59/15]|nr:hypothetical protein B0H10DRAFT_1949815 [Mycena sp. CBHHK59/15]